MNEYDDDAPQEEPTRMPGWIVTFADLMSLLMCFFVLMLSFSEIEVQKYKQLSGSMKAAFGVQKEIPAHEIPKGTSAVMTEFSPGKATKTTENSVRQATADRNREELAEPNNETSHEIGGVISSLRSDVRKGKLEIETEANKIILRITEKDSFVSGSSEINLEYMPVIRKVRALMNSVKGRIVVSGHTDDIPISNNHFRSNWELSAARAAAVVQALSEDGAVDPMRFEVVGSADTKPRTPNVDAASRAKNRRVEIVIEQDPKQPPIKFPVSQ